MAVGSEVVLSEDSRTSEWLEWEIFDTDGDKGLCKDGAILSDRVVIGMVI